MGWLFEGWNELAINGQLKELQSITLSAYKGFAEVSQELALTHYLGEGSLLGVIRHGGFIPWDDDIDVLMPRWDYDRLVKMGQPLLSARGLSLHCFETDSNHYTASAKVRVTGESPYVQKNIVHLCDNPFPGIDIFPLDFVPVRWSWGQAIQGTVVSILTRVLWARQDTLNRDDYRAGWDRMRRYWIPRFTGLLVPVSFLHKLIDRVMRHYNNVPNPRFLVNLGSYYGYAQQTIPTHVYGIPKTTVFEGLEVPVPRGSRYILTSIYGNYRRKPPPKHRKPKHGYVRATSQNETR